jgi:2,4-dienoyl-CoA reductase-like NADH-dependent reductase (Old Yellow Enzyme family)
MAHTGGSANPEVIGMLPVAPSPIPDMAGGVVPREVDQRKIDEIQGSFASAAVRLQTAGFDGVELHGAHHCLFTQFLSPLKNIRKDQYGGTIENRARMVLETIEKIKARIRPGFIVGYRICADEQLPGGITPEDVVSLVKMLEKAGIDYISVTSGTIDSNQYIYPPMYMPRVQIFPCPY